MTSYFPDQESLVTILRYKVVIDEIVVTKENAITSTSCNLAP